MRLGNLALLCLLAFGVTCDSVFHSTRERRVVYSVAGVRCPALVEWAGTEHHVVTPWRSDDVSVSGAAAMRVWIDTACAPNPAAIVCAIRSDGALLDVSHGVHDSGSRAWPADRQFCQAGATFDPR